MTQVGYDPSVPEERFEASRVRYCASTAAGGLEGVYEADLLVLINSLQVVLRETLIVLTNLDVAGAIQRVGTTVGDFAKHHQAWLAQVGKSRKGITVDDNPGEAVRKLPTALPDATSATTIRFPLA